MTHPDALLAPSPGTASRRPRRARGRVLAFWARFLAVWALVFLTPGARDLVHDVVSVITGVECCGDHESEGSCPGTCAHCVCCAHPSATSAAPVMVEGAPALEALRFAWCSDDGFAPGYRAPPFRPPSS